MVRVVVYKVLIATFPAFLILGLLFSSFQAQLVVRPKNSKLEPIRAELNKNVSDGSFPSVSVGVLQNGKTVWKESFGYSDVERKIAATPNTVYALGSLSKSITGTAVYKLVQEGKVDLEKPIHNYLKTVSIDHHGRDPDEYKVYHLLNMAAGVPHYWRYCYTAEQSLANCSNELFNVASFSAFAPGEAHIYSNQSFGLAAQLIADVSQSSLSRFMWSQIFRPAGMRRTYVNRNDISQARVDVAVSYKRDGSRAPEFQFEPTGGGGFWSNVTDLLRYGAIHLYGAKVPEPLLTNATLRDNHKVRPGLPHAYYANGWGVLPLPRSATTLLSNGAIEGAASTLLIMPDLNTVVVVLINKSVGNDASDRIAFSIADALFPGYKKELDSLFEKVGPQFADKPFRVNDQITGVYIGQAKVNSTYKPFKLVVEGDKLSVSMEGEPAQVLKNVTVQSETVTGRFQHKFSYSKEPQEFAVTFRQEGDKLTGFLMLEVLKPRPDRMIAYYFSATKN